MSIGAPDKPRLIFIANSMYANLLSGGDIHTINMAVTAIKAGYSVHFFAGHALKSELERRGICFTITLTDKGVMPSGDFTTLRGQLRLLWDYLGRLAGSLHGLSEIQEDDVVYANSEFWWDSLPAIFCKSRRKLLFLAMDCPTLFEIIGRSRPDITRIRLPSLHYWMSQMLTLWTFRLCREKRMLYVHPNQKPRLSKIGYRENELFLISSGVDLASCLETPAQEKTYDVIWTGRVHPQKGIEDLVATLAFLAMRIGNFRAIIVGNVKQTIEPRIKALGLTDKIEFAGFVSEAEKFRLMKSSRLFLMPSRYESWGTVIAEALASGLPVLAYDLEAYRPIFGNLLQYVKPFDVQAFKQAAVGLIEKCRANQPLVDQALLHRFKQETTWQAAGGRFLNSIQSMK
jgi:glycosyltransferase involved in cell wall biosynthesis